MGPLYIFIIIPLLVFLVARYGIAYLFHGAVVLFLACFLFDLQPFPELHVYFGIWALIAAAGGMLATRFGSLLPRWMRGSNVTPSVPRT